MTPRQISVELENWADIFLMGVTNPERLHVEHRSKIEAMQYFLKELIREAVISGRNTFPKSLLYRLSAKLSYLKGELTRFYNKGETPSEKILEKIPETYALLFNLANQYKKISR